jgi:hypothetical protein
MKQSNQIDVALVMTKIIDFLALSMCQTIAKTANMHNSIFGISIRP